VHACHPVPSGGSFVDTIFRVIKCTVDRSPSKRRKRHGCIRCIVKTSRWMHVSPLVRSTGLYYLFLKHWRISLLGVVLLPFICSRRIPTSWNLATSHRQNSPSLAFNLVEVKLVFQKKKTRNSVDRATQSSIDAQAETLRDVRFGD
jgi:hypothetical protein